MSPEQFLDALDCTDPETLWRALTELLKIREQRARGIAQELRSTAESALEDAAVQDEMAAEFAQMIRAIERAPVTFPASVGRNPEGQDPEGLGAEHEHAVPSEETGDAQPSVKSQVSHD